MGCTLHWQEVDQWVGSLVVVGRGLCPKVADRVAVAAGDPDDRRSLLAVVGDLAQVTLGSLPSGDSNGILSLSTGNDDPPHHQWFPCRQGTKDRRSWDRSQANLALIASMREIRFQQDPRP